MTAVPFTAFCPECKGHRTFTIINEVAFAQNRWEVGCCVCGTSEREALVRLSERVTDDKDSMGELAARLNTLDGELAELRDDHIAHVADTRRRHVAHLRVTHGLGLGAVLAEVKE